MEEEEKTRQETTENVGETDARGGKSGAGISRRTLCLGIGGAAVMLGLGGIKAIGAESIIRPPGGQDEEHLISACIRCQKCYEICPRHVIKPAHIEDGILNMRTPTLDFSDNWCDYCAEHNDGVPKCAQTCPTGALVVPPAPAEKTAIIGKAVIDTDLCLAYRLIGCKFCSEICPYEAIELDGYGRPSVHSELCNGCGACESVCASMRNGSISAGATTRAIIVLPVE